VDILLIGWSDIVRRRILPALAAVDGIDLVHVATGAEALTPDWRSAGGPRVRPGRVFAGPGSWQRALAELPPALAYASGTNVDHAPRTRAALAAGWDVIVDKPAFLDPADLVDCLVLARQGGRLLAEATVWSYHAQVTTALDAIGRLGLQVREIEATFTVPALPPTNFRTDPALGGGAVADLGVYGMSPARVFGSGRLVDLGGRVTGTSVDGLDSAFSVEATYSDGTRMTGAFSLDAAYTNLLKVGGPGWSAFSSRPDAPLAVAMTVEGEDRSLQVSPCDPFAAFLDGVVSSIARGLRAEQTDRTEQSATDLLALADALGIDWRRRTGVH
jgi:predicted dehydrogenase